MLVFSVFLHHWLGRFRALLSTVLHPPFSLFLQGQKRAQRPGQCCEECVSPAGSCLHNGIERYQDEMWKGSACEFCTCDRGQVTCQTGECAKVECAQVRSKGIPSWTETALSGGIGGPSPFLYFLAAERMAWLTAHISRRLPAQRFCGVKSMSLFVQTGVEQPPGPFSFQCIWSDWKP